MEEVKNTDTGEGLGNNMGKDGARGLSIHGRELAEDIEQLGQAIDDDEEVGNFELLSIPEYHPS